MSELTRCSYCTLQDMRRRARIRGVQLITRVEGSGTMRGWTSVRYSNENEPSAYFLQLTTHCVC